jgi:hypothetical protein
VRELKGKWRDTGGVAPCERRPPKATENAIRRGRDTLPSLRSAIQGQEIEARRQRLLNERAVELANTESRREP